MRWLLQQREWLSQTHRQGKKPDCTELHCRCDKTKEQQVSCPVLSEAVPPLTGIHSAQHPGVSPPRSVPYMALEEVVPVCQRYKRWLWGGWITKRQAAWQSEGYINTEGFFSSCDLMLFYNEEERGLYNIHQREKRRTTLFVFRDINSGVEEGRLSYPGFIFYFSFFTRCII